MPHKTHRLTPLAALLCFASLASARTYATSEDLAALVRTDSTVLERFERHFGLDQDRVIEYVGRLHPGTLSKSGLYSVYRPGLNGIEIGGTVRLSKGEAVFFDRGNVPTLLADGACPIEASLSDALKSEDAGGMNETTGAVATTPSLGASAVAPAAVYRQGPEVTSGAGSASPWLGVVPVLIPLIGATNSGHVGGGNGNTHPVPEPSTMLILGMGGAALLVRRKKL